MEATLEKDNRRLTTSWAVAFAGILLGRLVGQADFPHTTPFSLGLTGGMTVGADPGAPVAPYYEPPFEFTGTIHSVTFDVSGELIQDSEAEMRQILARQ